MSTRKEKFEATRMNMLSSLNGENPQKTSKENTTTIKEEPQPKKKDNRVRNMYKEQLERLKKDAPSAEEYKRRVDNSLQEHYDFLDHYHDLSKEEQEKELKNKQKQIKTEEENFKKNGPVNAYGNVINAINVFNARAGGGPLFWFIFCFYWGIPGYYMEKSQGFALIMFLSVMFLIRFLCMMLSFIITPFYDAHRNMYPPFVCDIIEGSIADKAFFSWVRVFQWIIAHIHFPAFMCVGYYAIVKGFSSHEVFAFRFFNNVSIALMVCLLIWTITYFIPNTINQEFVKNFIKANPNVKYRLRYLFDPSRVIVDNRQGSFVSPKEMDAILMKDERGIF